MADLFGTMFPDADDPDYWRRLGELIGNYSDLRPHILTDTVFGGMHGGIHSLGIGAVPFRQESLEKILEGEPPYDIFVRWKPQEKQPVGWDPERQP